MIDSMPF